jgi:hypothetical protein
VRGRHEAREAHAFDALVALEDRDEVRGPTAAQRIALLWSKPKCANEACSSMFVQLDHREGWAETHRTVLDDLDPLCPHDHDLKTYEGWSLVEGTGRRAFVPPDDPRHPRNKPPP